MGYNTHIGKVKSCTEVTHNDEADTAARKVVGGHKTPDIRFTDANPPIRGLRTRPQIRGTKKTQHPTYTTSPTYTQAYTHSSEHTHTTPRLAIAPSMDKSYTTLEPRDRTTQSMHTLHHPTGLGGTRWRWHGEYISTDVKKSIAHPSYAPNAIPHSQTRTY